MKKNNVLYFGVAAVVTYALVTYSTKKTEKKTKEFKAYKAEVFKSLNMYDMILYAGSNNRNLDMAHRIIAKQVLDYKKNCIDNATNIEEFDSRVADFKACVVAFTDGIDEEACVVEVEVAGKKLDYYLQLQREQAIRNEERLIKQQENQHKERVINTVLAAFSSVNNNKESV